MKITKPNFWKILSLLLALCVILLLIFVLRQNIAPQTKLPEPQTLAASLDETANIQVSGAELSGYSSLSGQQLKKWLNSTSWQPQSVPSPYELAADYIIEDIPYKNQLYEIRLYTSEPTLVMLLAQDKWQYYKIDEIDYQNFALLVLTSSNLTSYEEGQAPVSVEQALNGLFADLIALPQTSSNPNDYIYSNQNVFNQILGYSNSTLLYCFKQFEKGGQTDLKGNLMMIACRTLCQREDIDLAASNGQQWYDAFKAHAQLLFDKQNSQETQKDNPVSFLLVQMLAGQTDGLEQEIVLPDFQYQGEDFILKLVYDTELEQYESRIEAGFLVTAVHIHDTSREESKLKVFATINTNCYRLFGKDLKLESGGVIPVAITFGKTADGIWQFEQYTMAQDGSSFAPSIKNFCTTPVSEKNIKGLANKILKHYGDYEDLSEQQNTNLLEHLLKYKQSGVSLKNDYNNDVVPLTKSNQDNFFLLN